MPLSVNKHSRNKKIIIATIILAVVLLLSAGAAAYYFVPRNTETDNTQTTESSNASPSEQSSIDNDEQLVPDQTIPQNGNPNQPSTSETARISIPNYQASGDTITVNTAIDESWNNNATCTMTVSGPTSIVIKENVFAQAQISGCQLQATGLQPGSYTVTIYAEQGSSRTNTETLTINLK